MFPPRDFSPPPPVADATAASEGERGRRRPVARPSGAGAGADPVIIGVRLAEPAGDGAGG
ncbi:hypothetical protein FRACA_470010 [Frankia canadensis]|uniref:Uncharacterized protein n=1 Tax=Frankia canadensis TaxID=1836972 RepID=A0A2I2KXS3_9ACTN|nr:hypothetical protein FRACA_470010 [Frankia canadensis]SOU57752.1 hypothetical protein FRACA_470010 [Frankia canadensis]